MLKPTGHQPTPPSAAVCGLRPPATAGQPKQRASRTNCAPNVSNAQSGTPSTTTCRATDRLCLRWDVAPSTHAFANITPWHDVPRAPAHPGAWVPPSKSARCRRAGAAFGLLGAGEQRRRLALLAGGRLLAAGGAATGWTVAKLLLALTRRAKSDGQLQSHGRCNISLLLCMPTLCHVGYDIDRSLRASGDTRAALKCASVA